MADLRKITVGDTLMVPYRVTAHEGTEVRAQRDPSGFWAYFNEEVLATCEHIPAPKTFKRGDRVRMPREGTSDLTGGLVLGPGIHSPEFVRVDWAEHGTFTYNPDDLELETSDE